MTYSEDLQVQVLEITAQYDSERRAIIESAQDKIIPNEGFNSLKNWEGFIDYKYGGVDE